MAFYLPYGGSDVYGRWCDTGTPVHIDNGISCVFVFRRKVLFNMTVSSVW